MSKHPSKTHVENTLPRRTTLRTRRPDVRRLGADAKAHATTPADHLSTYFRELGRHGLLEPEEERDIARAIEIAEILTWEHLLSYPVVTSYLLGRLEQRLDNSLKSFRGLRKAAETARSRRTKANRQALRKCAAKTATELRALDRDRKHVDALIGELGFLQEERSRHGRTRLEFSPKSKSYAAYMREVREAQHRAARLRDEFVRANLRLVVTMARRYDRGVMPLSDLIQEGNLGLMHAVGRFDYRRGLRFSTYACWWIRHAIGRALADKARTVRVPVHMIEAQQQLAKVKGQLVRELRREPTRSEVAERSNMSMAKLNQMNRYLLGQSVSLDGPVHSEDGRTLGDILPDPASETWAPADDMNTRAMGERVREFMHKLTPIEADVLTKRFGLVDDEERTFREIGDQYHLSRERIRQIQNTALGKLRRALERADVPRTALAG